MLFGVAQDPYAARLSRFNRCTSVDQSIKCRSMHKSMSVAIFGNFFSKQLLIAPLLRAEVHISSDILSSLT
jgi:hypothetical protein